MWLGQLSQNMCQNEENESEENFLISILSWSDFSGRSWTLALHWKCTIIMIDIWNSFLSHAGANVVKYNCQESQRAQQSSIFFCWEEPIWKLLWIYFWMVLACPYVTFDSAIQLPCAMFTSEWKLGKLCSITKYSTHI